MCLKIQADTEQGLCCASSIFLRKAIRTLMYSCLTEIVGTRESDKNLSLAMTSLARDFMFLLHGSLACED